MSSELVPVTEGEIQTSLDSYSKGLMQYFESLGLPQENVLVSVAERRKVIMNLPSVIELVPAPNRSESVYISKFIAACGAGLFDAALNFIWDETVNSLREKVARFDLDYFYDSVVTNPDRRKKLRAADDLVELDDWELVRGCHLTGILTELGFRHLDYIRNMRNWASAAHPNQNELTGLQLISWLETCVREVIAKEPSGPVIEVKRLLHNIRTATLTTGDVPPIIKNIELLPHDLATSLLRTVFGMFVDPAMATTTRNNIRLIAKSAWDHAPEESRQELGVKYSIFAANGEISRRDAAREFLQLVDGLAYLPSDTLAVQLNEKIVNLYQAHIDFNNFHNEPAHARALSQYIPSNGEVPDSVRYSYVKTLIMCFVGNGYGVSNMAHHYYKDLIDRFQDPEILTVCRLLADPEIASRLQFSDCVSRFRPLVSLLKERTSNQRLIDGLEFIEGRTDQQLPNTGKDTGFKNLIGMK